ncbi:MAG: hypothetical protein N2254_01435 [bacterium]|nr:hypothetical protein [bacterium]
MCYGVKSFYGPGSFFSRLLYLSVPLLFSSLFVSCKVDVACKQPNLGELVDVKDGIVYDDMLFVLSSPQDVLGWCSAYFTVFKIDKQSKSVSPYGNYLIDGKIANQIVLVKDKIMIPLQDKNSIYFASIESIKNNRTSSEQIFLEVEDISYIYSYADVFLFSSIISRKIILAQDVEQFINSGGKSGFISFNYFLERPVIVEINQQNYVAGISEGENKVVFLPDKDFSVDANVAVFNYRVSEFSSNLSNVVHFSKASNDNDDQWKDISLFYPIKFANKKLFVPSKLHKDDNSFVSGILILYTDCIFGHSEGKDDFGRNVSACSFFLESSTGTDSQNIVYFDVFEYRYSYKTTDSVEVRIDDGIKLEEGEVRAKKEEKNFQDAIFYVFMFKEKKDNLEQAYIDLWLENAGTFMFLGRKYVESSPFYHILDISLVNEKILLSFIFSNKNIFIESREFP